MFIKLFGYALAAGIVFTSLAMIILGARFQMIEASVYTGKQRPWWFWLIAIFVFGLYVGALIHFIGGVKTWAGWALVVLLPLGWAIKAALVIFNPKGRQAVSSISGDQSWIMVGLTRLPIAIFLAILSWFA